MVGRERKWTEDPAKAQRVRGALEACIRKKGSDVSIAKLFQVMFSGVYKWCGENKSTIPYFRFNGTCWQQHKSTAGVVTLLSDVLAPEFEAEATKSFMEAKEKEESNKNKAKADEARGHRAAMVALDLENNSHRESAVKEIANSYHEEDFSAKLDVAEDLICFENGVYDLSRGQFRPGVPEDKLSISTGYDFVAEGFGHHAAVTEFFRRVYPDEPGRTYMLRSYAQMSTSESGLSTVEEEGYKSNILEKTGQRVCEIGGLGTEEFVHRQGDLNGKVKVNDWRRRIGVRLFFGERYWAT